MSVTHLSQPIDSSDLPPLGVDDPSPVVIASRRRGVIAFLALSLGLWLAREVAVYPSATWFSAAGLILAVVLLMASVTRKARSVTTAARSSTTARTARIVRIQHVLLAITMVAIGAGMYTLRVREPAPDSLARLLDESIADSDFTSSSPSSSSSGRDLRDRQPLPIRVRGVILEDARDTPRPRTGLAGFIPALDSARTTLRVEALRVEADGARPGLASSEWRTVSGRLWLRIQRPLDAMHASDSPSGSTAPAPPLLRAGDRVELTGLFSPIDAPENPGQTDLRPWAAAHHIDGSLKVPDPQLISVVSGGAGVPSASTLTSPTDQLSRLFLQFRAGLLSRASAVLGPAPTIYEPRSPGRTLLADLLLGQDNPADPHLQQAFTRLGLAHVLAISGFHLVVLAGVTLKLLTLTGDRGGLEPVLVAIAVIAYLLIVPVSAPVTRSGVMVLALLAAEIAGRRYDRLTILLWTAVAMLLVQPTDLWSLGFQLSYGLTATLLWLDQRAHAAIFGVRLKGTIRQRPQARLIAVLAWLIEKTKHLLSTSILCWLVAMPVISWHTGLASPLAVLTTVIITPVIILLLWAGFVLLLISAMWPALGSLLGQGLIAAADGCAWLVDQLDVLPGVSVRVPAFSLGLAAAATAVVIFWIRFSHRRDLKAWAITAVVAAWGVMELARPFSPRYDLGHPVSANTHADPIVHHKPSERPPADGDDLGSPVLIRANVLAAGDGACTIIRTPDRAILWDCGSSRPAFGRFTLPRATRALGVTTIRTAIISHSDLRHFSAIADAAESLGLREVLVTPALLDRAANEPQGPAAAAVRLLRERNVAIRAVHAGEEIDLGSATLRILSPPRDTTWTGDDQRSLIAVISSVPQAARPPVPSLLLTGQLSDDAVNALITANALPRNPVLILSGRGSSRALHELLLATDPRVILASNADPIDFTPIWAGEAEILQTSTHGAIGVSVQPASTQTDFTTEAQRAQRHKHGK